MRASFYAILCLLLVVLVSCSSQSGTTPTAPTLTPDDHTVQDSNTRQVWGVYDVSLDTTTGQMEVVPSRTSLFRMNVNVFMNNNPATLKLSNFDFSTLFTDHTVGVDVEITHPIPNKPKFPGFDVHLVMVSDGFVWLDYDPTLTYPVENQNTLLTNGDGWTRWYNAQEFTGDGAFGYMGGALGNIPNPTATLNPYKLFADGLASDADVGNWLAANQANRAIFTSGSTNKRRVEILFGDAGGNPVLKYQYVVAASWKGAGVEDPIPADFPPEANIQEASNLRIDTSDSTMYWTVEKEGGDLVVNVDIFDWQGGNDIGSEVAAVIIESPVLGSPNVDSSPSITTTPGSGYGSYTVTIPAVNLDSNDDVPVWVIVESADPTDYKIVGPTPYPEAAALSAINRTTASISDIAPADCPEVTSGINIVSGTTQCPDTLLDTDGTFGVTVTGGTGVLDYHWRIGIPGTVQSVPGYDNNPGDGAGQLIVDFTDPVFDAYDFLIMECLVYDEVCVAPAIAQVLPIYLNCIVFKETFEEAGLTSWGVTDFSGDTFWTVYQGTDNGSNLTGIGALWQQPSGGVGINSQGLLVAGFVRIPDIVATATIEIDHSYSFDPLTMGGNVKIGPSNSLDSVSAIEIPITSGDGYDGALTDSNNGMYPQQVFSAANTPSPLYTSYIDIPAPLVSAGEMALGFGAASGDTDYADGGWLIDEVRIRAVLK